MGAATKQVDLKILQDLVPLNELSDAAFSELAKKIVIEEVRARRYLFRKGDRDNQAVYLLAGRLNLVDGRRAVISELEGRTAACRFPLDNQQPRSLSARATTKVLVARVDSGLLEAFLAGNSANNTEVREIRADDNEDWMTQILQSEAVKKIPPSNIQQLLIKMEPFEVKTGDVVFSQGDEGTHFYTIHKGRSVITCTDTPGGEERRIGELSDGHSFGEEALVLNTCRNATVTMLTDGLLLRLPKDDFIELMQKPLVRYVPYDKAVAMVEEDAVWVDVREADDYEQGAIEDSVNIPLYSLRSEISELVYNAKYIICCENGQRSVSAAFILSHRGFEVYVLEGGLEAAASAGTEASADTGGPVPEPAELPPAVAADEGEGQQETAHARIEEFRVANNRLAAEADQLRTVEQRLTAQLDQLRGELDAANGGMAELDARSKADADEKRALQDRIAALTEESAAQLSALERKTQQMQSGVEAEHGKREAQIEELQSALQQAREQQAASEAAVAAATAERAALQQDAGTAQQALQAQIEELQAALQQAGERQAASEAAVAAATAEREALQQDAGTAQQALQAQIEELQAALQQAGERQAASEAAVAAATAEREALQQDAGTAQQALQAQIEELRAALQQAGEQQAASEAAVAAATAERAALQQDAGTAQQALQAQIEELQAALQQAGERQAASEAATAAATAERAEERQRFETAHQDQQALLTGLQDELGHAGQQLESLQDELAGIRKEKQATESETQAALTESQGQVRELTEALQRNEQRAEALESGKSGLQQQVEALQAKLSDTEEKWHKLETDAAALQKARQEEQEQLFAAVSDRDSAQQLGENLREENSRLQEQFQQQDKQLKEQLAVVSGSADEQTRALQSRITELEQLESEKDGKLQALQAENDAQNKAAQQLAEEIEQLRGSQEEELQQSTDADERLRALEKDYQAAVHKANEDIARKDAVEQELQGQIERLRKQLEQTSSESQQVRKSVQGDVEQLREELHAERHARDEERAEMAARQRELKQQLATVAAEHEDNLARHEALLGNACDSARREERERVLQEVETREQTQPVAEVRKLELRVEELEQERNTSQQDQLETLEKLRNLQAELEAASAGSAGPSEDTVAALQAELEESRQNLEIAERLRSEAEAARDQLAAEFAALPAEPEEELVLEELYVPSLDDGDAGASHPGPPDAAVPENTGVQQDGPETAGKKFSYVVEPRIGRFNLLGWGLGLGVAGIAAAAIFWASAWMKAPLPDVSGVAGPDAHGPDTPIVEAVPAAADSPATEEPDTVLLTVAPGRTFRDALQGGGRGPLMVELPAASFPMGSIGNSLNFDEGPRHYVTLARFSIGRHEVTFAEYERFARATGRRLPYDEGWGRGDRPVINISWKDANAYAAWLSSQTGRTYRLPTEAQWEFAARAGTTGNHWWDKDRNTDTVRANCFGCGSQWDGDRTAPVGQFPANPFGIHDTAGNVQEWTRDCYRAGYRDASADGAAWHTPECTQQVVRGGSYSSPMDSLRSAKRNQYDQDTRLDNLGFRVVRIN